MDRKKIFARIVPVITFVILLVFTTFVSNLFYRSLIWRVEQGIKNNVANIVQLIDDRVVSYIDTLYSVRGVFVASDKVSRKEWKDYIKSIELANRHPGVSSFTFIERVSLADKGSFVSEVRQDTSVNPEGYPDFKITPEIEKAEYYIGKYVEPEEGRTQVLGFDFSSEVSRNRSLNLARDRNSATASDVLKLVTTQRYGVNLALPIYKNGVLVDTESARRNNLFGFVIASLRIDDFFKGIVESANIDKDIIFEVYDVDNTGKEVLLFSNNEQAVSLDKHKVFVERIKIADRSWLLKVYSIVRLEDENKLFFYVVLAGGVFVSALLSVVLFNLFLRRDRALKIAAEMTADLRESEERFKAITESAKDAIVMMDDLGRVVLWNKAAELMFGYTFEEMAGKDLHNIIPFEKKHRTERANLSKFFQTGFSNLVGKEVYVQVKNKKGERIDIELTISRTQLKGAWHAIGIMRDVTVRKKQEEELRARTEELERINKNMVGRELKMIELKEEVARLKDE